MLGKTLVKRQILFVIKLNKFQYFKVYCEQVSTKSAAKKLLYSRLLNLSFQTLCLRI